jgi:hypothetical protein
MKLKNVLLIMGAALALAGCASYQGGTAEDFNTTTGYSEQEVPITEPTPSPTFRPGMNPEDPRDPHYTIRPQPKLSPPTTPQ